MIRTLSGLATAIAAAVALAAAAAPAPPADDGDPRGGSPDEAAAVGLVWGGLDAPIRPGASLGGYCTFNFVFFDAVTGTPYIGTAAHCTDEVGERVELRGTGEIGTVAFDSDDIGSAVDFSLIELDADLVASTNPTMLGWEHGPVGAVTIQDLAVGDQIDLHGHGIVLGWNDLTRSRFGYLVDWTEEGEFVVDMPAVNGDSGSPLLHDATGKAFGVVSRYGLDGDKIPSTDVGPMLPFIFRELGANGFADVVVATIE